MAISPFAYRSTGVTVAPVASGRVTGDTGALTSGFNVLSVTRVSEGLYDVVLESPGIIDGDRMVLVTLRQAGAPGMWSLVGALSATTFSIETYDITGAVSDRNFDFVVIRRLFPT